MIHNNPTRRVLIEIANKFKEYGHKAKVVCDGNRSELVIDGNGGFIVIHKENNSDDFDPYSGKCI